MRRIVRWPRAGRCARRLRRPRKPSISVFAGSVAWPWSYARGGGWKRSAVHACGRPERHAVIATRQRGAVRITRPDRAGRGADAQHFGRLTRTRASGEVAANDALLDAMALSRGRSSLMAPAVPERSCADCRLAEAARSSKIAETQRITSLVILPNTNHLPQLQRSERR